VGNNMLLYASTIDVSVPNGPGVNEREFVCALQRRFGEKVRFLLPVPADPSIVLGLGRLRTFPKFSSRMMHWALQLAICWQLFCEIRRRKPALIIFRCGQLPVGLAVFAKLSRVPIVLKTQGDPTMQYLCDKPGLKGWLSRRLRPINLWAVQVLVDRAVSVDCCTRQLVARNRDYLRRVADGKIVLIENATNVQRFQPASATEARRRVGLASFSPVIGYVGGVPWERGGRQIILAVARLRDRYPGIAGAIVGGAGPEWFLRGLGHLRRPTGERRFDSARVRAYPQVGGQ